MITSRHKKHLLNRLTRICRKVVACLASHFVLNGPKSQASELRRMRDMAVTEKASKSADCHMSAALKLNDRAMRRHVKKWIRLSVPEELHLKKQGEVLGSSQAPNTSARLFAKYLG